MATTLSGSHSSSVAVLTTAADEDLNLAPGTVIAVESELMRFEGYGRIDGHRSKTKLNVTRGIRGTTKATHANTTPVTVADARQPSAAIANASTAHALNATFSDTEVEAALDALGTKVNAILAAMRAEGTIKT